MTTIAVGRIKKEFQEVVKSDEVCVMTGGVFGVLFLC